MLRPLAILVLATAPGCLTFTARVRGGPTLDTRGNGGFEVGLALGIGIGGEDASSMRTTPFAAVGNRGFSFGTSIERGSLDRELAWHAGIAAGRTIGDDAFVYSAYGAAMRPLWFDSDYAEDEKFSLASSTHRALSAGLEARAGFAVDEARDSRGVFGLMPVLDITISAFD